MKFGPPYIKSTLSMALVLGGGFTMLWVGWQSGDLKVQDDRAAKPETAARAEPTVPVSQTPAKKVEIKGPLANFDLRQANAGQASLPRSRAEALAKLQQMIPGLSVEFDSITQSPKWIGSNGGLLSGKPSNPVGKDADAPVRQFIDAHRGVFGHGAERLDGARRVTDYTTSRSGSRKVVWHQQLDGVDIFEAVFQANLTADAELINVGSHLMADPEAAASDANRASLLAELPVTAEAAVAAAGQEVGERVTKASVRPSGPPAAEPDRKQTFRAAMLTDAEAKLIWVPMDAATLRLAWDVTVSSRTRAEMYRVLVDATTADILVRQSLTAYLSEASYRVFTTESPTPFSPGHETPSSLQPALVDRVLVTTSALNATASPNGWINDGSTLTSGNNADAYTDSNADNVADLPRTQGTAARVFDFPLDLNQEPSTYKNAAVTQLFYWTNFAHDRLYELGFTEAAGNFQVNNFGRGGAGNDPVNAEAQDGSGTNNANFSSPVDGGRGRMQMFLWTSPNPDRDGAFEAEVVLHEYCHGLSNRLVGGPSVTISALSTVGLGEGWSDFYGMALTAEAKDNPHGNWARAGYSRYQSSGWLSENFYYGARRYSYSTDMLKNPFTFKDIDPARVDWHTNVARNPTFAATEVTSQAHYLGTVWCTMLWDLRANLIFKHGFLTGNERAMFLVTEGMKLGPANPNFVQARDGILQAALINHPGDLGEVWTAFAKRGLGQGAAAPASSTVSGVTESYWVPDSLEISDRSGWNITGSAGGLFAPAAKAVTLSNDGGSALNWTVAPHAAWLSASPGSGSLAPGASVTVTLTPQAELMAPGFHSTNVVFTNATSGFTQPIGVRLYVTPSVVLAFPLNTDPGWTRTGEWAFGRPTGAGGGTGISPDPLSGATGSNVFGVNLSGNPATTLTAPHYLTLGPVDLSTVRQTRLRFMRWLNTNALAKTRVTVEVSKDGNSWHPVFINPGTAITDTTWRPMEYDISSIADQQSRVYVRWSYQNLAAPGTYSGWNIDDVEILGDASAKLTLDLTDTVLESGGPINGNLLLSHPQGSPVTATLTSSDPSAATVPTTVTFNPGESSRPFSLIPVNDANVDGTRTTVIAAAAPDLIPSQATVTVMDDETATLTLTAPATVMEGAVSVAASVSVSHAPARDVTVLLQSSHTALMPPVSVVIPAGSAGPVGFTLNAPDNGSVEAAKMVTLTATVAGWTPGSTDVSVTDNDVPALAILGSGSLREGDGTQIFTVMVNARLSAPLVVKLTSSDLTEITVPATLTLPAGQLSANFNGTIVNDTLADGVQTATLTAKAVGYLDASRPVSVADNEVSAYTIAPIPSPQKRNKPIALTITARDINGLPITNCAATLTLKSASPGGVIPFSPLKLTGFNNGVAAGSVTVTTMAVGMTLTATDATAKKGISNAFNVDPGTHESFVWSGLPTAAVAQDALFSAKVVAMDDAGTVATNYTSPTVVEAYVPVLDRTVGSLTATTTTTKIYNTAAHDSRVQLIYTAAELGSEPRWIGALQTSLVTAGGQVIKAFNIRLKHTDRESFAGGSWEQGDWTVVHTTASAAATATYFTLTKPFFYNGTQNLMVDISFNNATATKAGVLRQVPAAANRVLSGTSNSTHGDPLAWTALTGPAPVISNELPTLTFYTARSLGPIPDSPVAFAAGAWSGKTFAPTAANQAVWLLATAPTGIYGFSTKVTLAINTANPASTGIVVTDGFESGVLGAAWSTAGSSGATARTRITTANVPKAGKYHLTMDTTSTVPGTFARNSPTLRVNLAGRRNVMLDWHAKSLNDEAHAPVLTGPLGSFDSAMNYDGVAISPDGVTWVEVAPLRNLSTIYGTVASRVFLDPIVQRMGWDYNGSFQIRFSQYDDQAVANDGVAIDEVTVRANLPTAISVSMPMNLLEGTMSLPVIVSVPVAPSVNTAVTLTSNSPAHLTISSPITILAGQTTATAAISAPQNRYASIGKDVIVTASARGQTGASFHTRVVDDEHPVLTLGLPTSVTAGSGAVTGVVTLSSAVTSAVQIFLNSSDGTQLGVDNFVTIPFGQSSATFSLTQGAAAALAEPQAITITASGQGLVEASAVIEVVNGESETGVAGSP